jgi:hypothetical protein
MGHCGVLGIMHEAPRNSAAVTDHSDRKNKNQGAIPGGILPAIVVATYLPEIFYVASPGVGPRLARPTQTRMMAARLTPDS